MLILRDSLAVSFKLHFKAT